LLTSPALLYRDLLQDVQNGANSLVAFAATRVSDATGYVESALSSAVAALPELPQIEDYVPVNCTFGIHQFCVGCLHAQDASCSDSPFDISALLPDAIQDLPAPLVAAFRELIDGLSPLADRLSRLPTLVGVCLILGLSCMMILLGVFCYQAYVNYCTAQGPGHVWHVVIYLIMATVCCAPYLTLILLQRTAVKDAMGFPDWVEVQAGAAFGLSIGILVCTVVFVALSAICLSPKVVSRLRAAAVVRKGNHALRNLKSSKS
jgi:hypothetical protein